MAQAAAAALLVAGGAWAAFDFTDDVFDHQDELHQRWREAQALRAHVEQSRVRVDVVDAGPPVVLTLTNEGATTLDAAALTVLLDGERSVVASWTVDGRSSDVWPPLSTLEVTMDAAETVTDRVAVATGHGVMAYGGP